MIETILTFIIIWFCLGAVYFSIKCIDEDYNPTTFDIIIEFPMIFLGILAILAVILRKKIN